MKCTIYKISCTWILRSSTSKMFLSYVRVKSSNEAHMVLTYFETPSSEPLVLDNLRKNTAKLQKMIWYQFSALIQIF